MQPVQKPVEAGGGVRIEVPVTAEQLLRVLVAIAVGFFVVSLAIGLVWAGPSETNVLHRYFFLDREQTLPAWYSSAVLLGAAVLAYAATATVLARRWSWWVLALLLLVMSADEIVSAHEHVSDELHEAFDTGGILFFAWVVPGAVVVVIAVLAFAPLIRSLDDPVRRPFVAGAALFVFGALVLEALNGAVSDASGSDATWYVLGTHLEELCEMLGACLVLYALTRQVNGSSPG